MGTGTAELIVQAIDKLVENAVRFAPTSSTIELGLRIEHDVALIRVRNRGPALPDGDTGALFDSFVTIERGEHRTDSHLGFGLYITRLIVEAHGGYATARNWSTTEGSGAEFELVLPLSE
jgi:K+-sensing histidine kinase KdpD